MLLAPTGSDPDGDTLTWSAAGLPPGLSFDPATGTISGTLGYEAAAGSPYVVAVTAADDGSPQLSSGVSFLWTVADTNRPPQVLDPGSQAGRRRDRGGPGDDRVRPRRGRPRLVGRGPAPGPVHRCGDRPTSPGSLTYEAAGTHPVTVTATDDGTPQLSSRVIFAWEVAGTNRAPMWSTPEGGRMPRARQS